MTIVFGSPAAQRVLERDKALRHEWPEETLATRDDLMCEVRENYCRWREYPANVRDLERGCRLRHALWWLKRRVQP